jgi:hypothetical protein
MRERRCGAGGNPLSGRSFSHTSVSLASRLRSGLATSHVAISLRRKATHRRHVSRLKLIDVASLS